MNRESLITLTGMLYGPTDLPTSNEFQYACFTHTYIVLFVEAGQCATKN